ncbi:MAG: hypothetical protein FWD24_00520 [Treponema sp.]|nr:hypothetical protein [Treponema sp.]
MKGSKNFSDIFIKFLNKRQQEINQQLKESEKKFKLQQEEKKQFIENAEKEFFNKMDKKKKHLDETGEKILSRIEENRIKIEVKDENNNYKQIKISGLEDILSGVDVSLNPKAKNVKNNLIKLETLIQEAGFTVVERTGNTIKIDVK